MKSIKWKVLTSFLLTLSFFSASLSGVLLYFSPRGRIANWTEWTLVGLTKTEWTSIHLTAVAVVLITALLHLFWFNWRVFLSYLKRSATGAVMRYPRELGAAVVLFLVITLGTLFQWPGVYALINGRTAVEDSFEIAANQPPVAHAEELTVRTFAADILEKPVEEVLSRLEKLGWVAAAEETFVELAENYGVSPKTIYDELLKEPVKTGTGAGWGRMSLKEVAETQGVDLETLLKRAEEMGATGLTGDELVKDVAESLGMASSEFLPALDPSLTH